MVLWVAGFQALPLLREEISDGMKMRLIQFVFWHSLILHSLIGGLFYSELFYCEFCYSIANLYDVEARGYCDCCT